MIPLPTVAPAKLVPPPLGVIGMLLLKAYSMIICKSSSDFGNALTTGSDGSIYIAGYTEGDLDGISNAGGKDAFISKYDSNGNKIWSKTIKTDGTDIAYNVVSDSNKNVYIAGFIFGDLKAGGDEKYRDGFITKFDSNGNYWNIVGNTIIGPNGQYYNINGNVITGPNGQTSIISGNSLINSDGSIVTRAGNSYISSNGSMCTVSGSVVICN